MLYFQEYRGLSALDASMFALGVTVRRGGEGRRGAVERGGAGGKGDSRRVVGMEGREAGGCGMFVCRGVVEEGRYGGRLVWRAAGLREGWHVAF
jgi:hypothetical protein